MNNILHFFICFLTVLDFLASILCCKVSQARRFFAKEWKNCDQFIHKTFRQIQETSVAFLACLILLLIEHPTAFFIDNFVRHE